MYVATADEALSRSHPKPAVRSGRTTSPMGPPSKRGLGLLAGHRRVAGACPTSRPDDDLIALDAANGQPVTEFGAAGVVDMGQVYNGAPTVYKNLVLVGTNTPPGAVRGFDTRTGAKVWEFRSVPQEPKRPGSRPGKTAAGKDQAGAISWAFSMTIDPQRNTLYAIFDSPTPDYYGGDRHGDNLFANSVVALDAETGAYKWHFQTTHHDLWDYDIPSPPALLDVSINGRMTPVLAVAHKTGYMYVLNRDDGKPVFGIEERPVPASEVPGEQSSPTQPIPVKPGPIARVSYTPGRHRHRRRHHRRTCRLLQGARAAQRRLLQRRAVHAVPASRARARRRGRRSCFPGSVGGANWGGTASDPELGYIFVNTMDEASIGWIEKRPVATARRLPAQ